jgi:hypothetical protein
MARREKVSARYAIGFGARSGVDATEAVALIRKVYEIHMRAPFPASGRTQPGAAGADEVPSHSSLRDSGAARNPHPTSLREAAFSHAWEKEWRVEISLFTIETKRDEPGLLEAARWLATTLVFLPLESLLTRRSDLLTHSARVKALTGVGSVAEAAALVGAGPGSVLLGPRIASARATCAIARNALDEGP